MLVDPQDVVGSSDISNVREFKAAVVEAAAGKKWQQAKILLVDTKDEGSCKGKFNKTIAQYNIQ